MKRKLVTAIALVTLCVVTLTLSIATSRAQRNEFETPQLSQPLVRPSPASPPSLNRSLPTDCAIQPATRPARSSLKRLRLPATDEPVTLSRFRRFTPADSTVSVAMPTNQRIIPAYVPREEIVVIHPTNFGDRFLQDINGRPVSHRPIVVLHETVASASSTLNFFRTPHPRDEDQASYHTLIRRDGTIVYLVPPDKRAFGAGNSVFQGDQGIEAVKTHPRFPPSVNNFAYHISLETPVDGINNATRHSGYTDAQYQSLAWLVAKTAVTDDRITTHKAVDRSESRMDPRSFSFSRFFQLLQTYPKTADIPLQCTIPATFQSRQLPKPSTKQVTRPRSQTPRSRPQN